MFNFITPCTRKDNLEAIYKSIIDTVPQEDFTWDVVIDPAHSPVDVHAQFYQDLYDKLKNITLKNINFHIYGTEAGVAGKEQINYMLDKIPTDSDGWIYVIDDDNLLHPNFYRVLTSVIASKPEISGFCFSQEVSPGRVRFPMPKATFIDQAQYTIKRSLIGDERFLMDYCADGHFAEKMYNLYTDKFTMFGMPIVSYYNRLRWETNDV